MKVRRIVKFEFLLEDSVTDVEFVPSLRDGGHEVWVNGLFIEEIRRDERPSEARALYYYEVHGRAIDLEFSADTELEKVAVGSS